MDDYTIELETDRKMALWRAELSNGEIVVQDDNRPGLSPSSAWLRLSERLSREGLSIRRFWLQFRSHRVEPLPEDADGYFFCRSARKMLGGGTATFYSLIGAMKNGKLEVHLYSVPSLIHCGTSIRNPDEAGARLIRNLK